MSAGMWAQLWGAGGGPSATPGTGHTLWRDGKGEKGKSWDGDKAPRV